MQTFDLTTLIAVCAELHSHWIPAKIEQIYQRDRFTLALFLRTLSQRGWLNLSWHPVAARICLSPSVPKIPDTFTFSDQLRHQLLGLALINLETITPWERVIDLQFAKRPGETPLKHLYVEIMGKYSNVILTDKNQQIITVSHQVTANQSSFRTLQTGQTYQLPPSLTNQIPNVQESQLSWQQRVSLIPGTISRQLVKTYRGLSPSLVNYMLKQADLNPHQSTESLNDDDWQKFYKIWQQWLNCLDTKDFQPGLTSEGYNVLGWQIIKPVANTNTLIHAYYTNGFNQEIFQQLRHQLLQKVNHLLEKLHVKANSFCQRLQESQQAEEYNLKADLLMAYGQQNPAGMTSISLPDFHTNKPITITLNPEFNGIQNAQNFYKKFQKLKRARKIVEPLLDQVKAEIDYLEQIETNLKQLEAYQTSEDLKTLEEIREELIEQKYLEQQQYKQNYSIEESKPYIYQTPSGFELWVGRNNRQNEQITFRLASNYDLWFHTQEIAGSHVLLRLPPGSVADDQDLQFAANLAAYHSRASQSDQAPVVYTQPKHLYKPKGSKPGIVIYKQEKIIWGYPQQAKYHR